MLRRTRIKICGICRPQDALAAAQLGADAVGVVLAPKAGRFVTPELAKQIVAVVPPMVTTVALFVNASASEIRDVLRQVPFSCIQLHGQESPDLVAELQPIPVIKAVHLNPADPEILRTWKNAIADKKLSNLVGLLLETAKGPQTGGTGIENDFAGLRTLQERGEFEGLPPIIAAGGLNPVNVGAVVRLLRPYAVDVSSGVEEFHRAKSESKIEAFIRSVREADQV